MRADLAGQPSLALRVMVAHAIVGSPLWNVRAEAQRATRDAIAESLENCTSEAVLDEKPHAVLAVLGFDPETPTVTGGYDGEHGPEGLLVRLIEVLGPLVGSDMAKFWQADDALLDLIKDRQPCCLAR